MLKLSNALEFPQGMYILTLAFPNLVWPGEVFLRGTRVNAALHKQLRILLYFRKKKSIRQSLAYLEN